MVILDSLPKNKKKEKLMSDPRGLCSQSLSSINTLFVESNTKCAFVNNTMSAKNIFVVWKLGFCAGDHDLKKINLWRSLLAFMQD